MKIGLIGGTGDFGKGLALRLSQHFEVYVGSRYEDKAKIASDEYKKILEEFGIKPNIKYGRNDVVAERCDVIFLCIPYEHVIKTVEFLKEKLVDKILVSPVVPIKRHKESFIYIMHNGKGFASYLQEILPESKVVAALHTISAEDLSNLNKEIDGDVFVCGNDSQSKEIVSKIIEKIRNLKVYDVGDISMCIALESMTVALLNISKRYGIRNPYIKVFGSSKL